MADNGGNMKSILIDLDGVLNDYVGNYDKDFIPPIKFGAKEFLRDLSKNYVIKIFTTRNRSRVDFSRPEFIALSLFLHIF